MVVCEIMNQKRVRFENGDGFGQQNTPHFKICAGCGWQDESDSEWKQAEKRRPNWEPKVMCLLSRARKDREASRRPSSEGTRQLASFCCAGHSSVGLIADICGY